MAAHDVAEERAVKGSTGRITPLPMVGISGGVCRVANLAKRRDVGCHIELHTVRKLEVQTQDDYLLELSGGILREWKENRLVVYADRYEIRNEIATEGDIRLPAAMRDDLCQAEPRIQYFAHAPDQRMGGRALGIAAAQKVHTGLEIPRNQAAHAKSQCGRIPQLRGRPEERAVQLESAHTAPRAKTLDHGALDHIGGERRDIVIAADDDTDIFQGRKFETDVFAVVFRKLRRRHQDAAKGVAGTRVAGVQRHPVFI